ncbi:MAG: filamentation induced by cAMP protein Fic [Candidatus Peregrinibacteria bacterium GW2011_GWF2_33_10]|nr:MAG: filamentation induced by cAMP protein Fic [Candidatus Peregrinibacteria bacterium GW2011_GWF2_33_10]OGJ44575.1 MAG: addiction module protein [Candidatus Peregrinibacteria bacterium RIFOXYA2_FULL_33_21]OGJ44881.1 MAG: addiction module protein [Candidatus Peregrinibacteria bacterium RIFOXYA12_FULL_33_12]OGJ50038.1 MAG: addiction module protein [Candidatus Peregrinibacteria bacterium RIFOXYB2_FULL_33_20]
MYKPNKLPPNFDFESKNILKKLADARSALAELKGFVHTIPNQSILINSLALQEAKDSSAVENIITTDDEIFKAELDQKLIKNIATKEVQNYNLALQEGFKLVQKNKIIQNNCILDIQEILEENKAGYRKLPGTNLKNELTGEIVYEPPQNSLEIQNLMTDFVDYLNNDEKHNIDPLIKMAIIHFQFESIHPFYDGNGRTGRILNILYLISKRLLDLPILYLSRFIIQNKSDYYRLLQNVRDKNEWENWVIFTLQGVQLTSLDTINIIREIKILMQEYKDFLRNNFGFYSQDLLNNLFKHPYTKIEFVEKDLRITRQTASKYLNEIANHPLKLIEKIQVGKFSYFVNVKLFELLSQKRNVMLKK